MSDDPSIKVSIRTPTSTRAETVQETPDLVIEVNLNPYENLMHLFSMVSGQSAPVGQQELQQLLARSLHDGELHRDENLQLDINSKACRTTDLDKDCTICQNKYRLGEKLSTLDDCAHTFHFSCLKEWGMYKPECPLCRNPIPVLER